MAATIASIAALLTDPGIKADFLSLTASGVFTADDAITLLTDVANRGTVTAAEFTDLQTIASYLNAGVPTSDYVASEFTQIVDGSPANAVWNGGSATATNLGDLQIGTTTTQLTELVGKWLVGTDLPDPTGFGTVPVYANFAALPLYGAGGVAAVTDVNQGADGDCTVCSMMIEMVINHPALLQSMIVSDGAGLYGVRFYIGGNEIWVTVNSELPVETNGGNATNALFFAHGENYNTTNIWSELIEKAFAQLSGTGLLSDHPSATNSYLNISANSDVEVMKAFTNVSNVTYFFYNDSNFLQDKQAIINAISQHDDVILDSEGNTTDSSGNSELIADHALAIVGYDSTTGDFIVRNPWGVTTGQTWVTQFEVSMADVIAVQGSISIDNSAPSNVFIAATQNYYVYNNTPLTAAFSAITTDGSVITEYLFMPDGQGTINLNGAVNLANATQTAAGETIVSAADAGKLTFTPSGAASNYVDVLVAAYNGSVWSSTVPIESYNFSTGIPAVIIPAANHLVPISGSVSIASLITIAGVASSKISEYYISFANTLGEINLNGAFTDYSTSTSIELNSANFALLTYSAPSRTLVTSFQIEGYYQSAWTNSATIDVLVGATAAEAAQSIANGQFANVPGVVDTADNVFANLDLLQTGLAANSLLAITVTNPSAAAESIAASQFDRDKGALALITGNYALTVTGLSVSDALGIPSAILAHVAHLTISDSAATVQANLDALQALGLVSAVTLTDSGTPDLTITGAQLANDAPVLQDIAGNYGLVVTGALVSNLTPSALSHIVTVSVADTAANVSAGLSTLQGLAAAGKLSGITLSDPGTPRIGVTTAQFTADGAVFRAISGSYSFGIDDIAANVFASLDAVQSSPFETALQAISLSDTTVQSETLTGSQFDRDKAIIALIEGPYALTVTGMSVSDAVSLASTVKSHLAQISLSDSAANLQANLDAVQSLAAASLISAIALTDSGTPVLSVTGTQLGNDAGALQDITGPYGLAVTGAITVSEVTPLAEAHIVSVSIADTAANVIAGLGTLESLALAGKLTGISLTDSGTPVLSITAAQYAADTAVIQAITGTYTLDVGLPPGGSVTVTAPTSANINFTGTGTVVLSQPQTFTGGFTGLQTSDTINFVDTPFSALSVQSGVLKLYSARNVDLPYTVPDALSDSQLQLVSDGQGGSNLVVTAVSQSLPNFVAYQNLARGSNGVALDQAGVVSQTGNNVIGWQSAALGAGHNTVVLDGPRSEYAIQVDARNNLVIKDISSDNTTSGQSITVTGDTYLLFDGGAQQSSNADLYQNIVYVENSINSEIAAIYKAGLDREPDLPGLEYWQLQYKNGASLTSIAAGFLSSTEFKTYIIDPVNSTDTAFATALYTNVLNRTPDAGGLAYWVTQLEDGVSRASVLVGFATSTENLSDVSVSNGGWLADTAQGGYADPGNPLDPGTFLSQGVTDLYFNLGNVSGTVVSAGLFTTGTVAEGATLAVGSQFAGLLPGVPDAAALSITGFTNATIILSTNVNVVIDGDSADLIYAASSGGSFIGFAGASNGSNAYLIGNNNIVEVSGTGSASGDQVFNFVPATSSVQFASADRLIIGPWQSGTANLFTPSAASPVQGSSLTFVTGSPASHVENAINLGNIGAGTAAQIAAAANKLYVVADVPNEAILFFGQTAAGNVAFEFWGPSSASVTATADSNGNHQVDVSEFTASVTLIGIQASTITTTSLLHG